MVSAVQANSSTALPLFSSSQPAQGASPAQSNSPTQATSAAPKVDMQKLQEDLKSSLEKINQVMRDGGRNLSFQMDQSVDGPIISVRNSDTGEVIRQFPNEAVVRVAHNIDALKGVLYNGLF